LPGYTLIAPHAEEATLVAEQLTTAEAVLASMFKRAVVPNETPTTVILLKRSEWHRFVPEDPPNDLMPQSFATYLLLPSDLPNTRLRAAASHQAAHLFLRCQFTEFLPLWFDEGLAELMQSMEATGTEAFVGRRQFLFVERPRLEETLKQLTPVFTSSDPNKRVRVNWLGIERLIRVESTSPDLQSDDWEAIERESWLLMHRGLIAEPEFGSQIMQYLAAINGLEPTEAAIQRSFGMSESELDRAMFKYSMRTDFKKATLQIAPPKMAAIGRGRELSDGEAFELIAGLMLDSTASTTRINEVIAAAALRGAPEIPNLTVLRMRLAARDRNDAALEQLYRSSGAPLTDPAFARGAGLALFARVQGEARIKSLNAPEMLSLCERAFELLDRSLDARPDDPEAAWGYGMLAASLKRNLETALQRLDVAAKRMPRNADLSMAKALVHEANGNRAQMIVELNNTKKLSRSLQQRAFVTKRAADAAAAPDTVVH
jgi:tetratricopeptide (TPR) repeat protein